MKKALIVAGIAVLAMSGCAPTVKADTSAPEVVFVAEAPALEGAPAEAEAAAVDGRVTFISIIRKDVPKLAKYSDARLLALADLACTERASGIRLEDIDHIPNDGNAAYPAGELDRNIAAGAVLLVCPGVS